MTGKGQTLVLIILILALLVSCGLAVGWAIHYGTYKSRQTELAVGNTMLQQRADLLASEFDLLKARAEEALDELTGTNATLADTNDALATDLRDSTKMLEKLTATNATLADTNAALSTDLGGSTKTLEKLTATNETLADTNETLSADLGKLRETLQTIASDNINLIEQFRQLHEAGRKQSVQSQQNVSELTETVVALTADLKTANARLDELMDKLQAKTKEAADQAIKVNSLVEMVARLRVMTGRTTEPVAPTDPNLPPPADANSLPEG